MTTTNARNTDPVTSHLAGADIEHSGRAANQRELVRRALMRHGRDGITTAELAEAAGLDRYIVGRRMPELRKRGGAQILGYDADAPETRRCSVTGKRAMVCRPTGVPTAASA